MIEKKIKTINDLTEHEIQKMACNFMKQKNIRYFAIPNGFVAGGDKKNISAYRNYMRQEGLMVGMFDVAIFLGNGEVAFMEIKKNKGRPSDHQLEWLEYFKKNNYKAKICYGIKECINFIMEVTNAN